MTGSEKIDDNGLPVFDDEQEFQDYLEEKFEENGYTAIQEVSPADSRYRADLLLIHDEFGKIGLELKYMTGGTDAARAHQQIIQQYAGGRYLGDRVYLWAFAPYMPKLQHAQMTESRSDDFQRGKLEVIEHFFQRYGIGVLNVHSRPYARLKWGTSNKHMLPGFSMKGDFFSDGDSRYELESIRDRVSDRLFPEKDDSVFQW